MEDITDRTLKKRLTISLDYSLLAKLDNRNRSGDVERILREHFLIESGDKLYNYIINRMKKDGLLNPTQSMINGYQRVVQDEELENYRINYKDDGYQFRRYNGQLQVNKPPSRDWAGVEVLNY